MYYVITYEKDHIPQHGYKYVILNGHSSYDAYRTDRGFDEWLKRTQAKPTDTRQLDGAVITYYGDLDIEERLFWAIDELPDGVTAYTGLSNGSLVTCYFINDGKLHKIYRPNPNTKDVYKPLDLQSHITFIKERG